MSYHIELTDEAQLNIAEAFELYLEISQSLQNKFQTDLIKTIDKLKENPQNPEQLTILEENNYYPFGLKHANYNKDIQELHLEEYTGISGSEIAGTGQQGLTLVPALENEYQYKYQGQERQTELNLNVDMFKYRSYDYAIGRFWQIDPMSEKFTDWAPYVFSGNRVVDGIELEGAEFVLRKHFMNGDEHVRTEDVNYYQMSQE